MTILIQTQAVRLDDRSAVNPGSRGTLPVLWGRFPITTSTWTPAILADVSCLPQFSIFGQNRFVPHLFQLVLVTRQFEDVYSEMLTGSLIN
jgi:hypothetical protein